MFQKEESEWAKEEKKELGGLQKVAKRAGIVQL